MSSAAVWVTGARGFIGRYLARELARQATQVSGLGHGLWTDVEAREWGVERWLNGEVRTNNLQALARVSGPPQVIFHLAGGGSVGAAITQPREDFSRTVVSTAELLEWVRLESLATHVIVVSSAAVYGTGRDGPLPEESERVPCSPYGFHKSMMEQICESYATTYGVRSTIVRLFSVYGAGLRKQLLWDLCSRLLSPSPTVELAGSGNELRDWTDVRDVARALTFLRAWSGTPVSVVNAATGIATSVAQIADLVVRNWSEPRSVTFSGLSRPGDPFSLVADCRRLTELGFEWRVPIERGIADYVQWFLTQAGRRL
jgi:UDP-glucose 4-epimerase